MTGAPNIKGKGVETFSNILSEVRAYGEGGRLKDHLICLVVDFLPDYQERFIGPLSVCYLIHRLQELRWSFPIQRWLLDNMAKAFE